MQPIEPRLQFRLPVALPEEPRIAEPPGDDALGILRDDALVFRLGVDDGQERFLQFAVLGDHREVMLMVDERRREHFLRQRQKGAIEEPCDHGRILDEVGDLVDERVMLLEHHAAAQSSRMPLEIAGDAIAPLRVIEDDEMLLETSVVFLEAADLDRASGTPAGREEPVSVGQRPGANLLDLRPRRMRRPANHERDDTAAVEKQQPANRAPEHELGLALVERRVPSHLFGERQIAQHLTEDVGERVDRALAALAFEVGQVLAAGSCRATEIGDGHALLLRKSGGCRCGCAVRTERRRYRRPRHDLLEVLLALGDLREAGGETPRRAVGLDRRPGRNAVLLEARLEPFTELTRQTREPRRGQLFDADFDQ